jgi:cytochrome P450
MRDLEKHIEAAMSAPLDPALFQTKEGHLGMELLKRPYHFLNDLQARYGDVVPLERGVLEGVDFSRMWHTDPDKPSFLILGYAANDTCMNRPDLFGQGHPAEALFGEETMFGNPPGQIPWKALVMKGFSRQRIQRLDHEVLRPASKMMADRMLAKGRGDLVTEFTGVLPFIAISALFDLPPEWSAKFLTQGRAVVEMGFDMAAGYVALGEQRAFFTHLMHERREKPGDDLLSWLTQAEIEGRPLRNSEIVSLCLSLVPAGTETTGRVMGQMFTVLLKDPGEMAALRRDRSRIPAVVAETLRWDGPVPVIPKIARQQAEVAGVTIPAGGQVFCCIVQADRDASRWERPHEYDPDRPMQPVLAFGGGAHYCAGHLLARTELETALDVLLDLPDLRLDPDREPPEVLGMAVRQAATIPYRVGAN